MEEKRKISLRLFAQLFNGELLDKPLYGRQLIVAEISDLIHKQVDIDHVRQVIESASHVLSEIDASIVVPNLR
jgi:hypothetical protein